MRKNIAFVSAALLLLLSGCTPNYNNSSTRILMDTVVNIEAEAEQTVINEAFSKVEQYENLFSRTIASSEVSRLNCGEVFEVSEDTLSLINSSIEYSKKSGGAFDITIGSVSSHWDFANGIKPEDEEIKEYITNVSYEKIKIVDGKVNLCGANIDLGGAAKGFIADKLRDFLREKNVENATINLGGNLVLMGKIQDIGVKNPFSDGTIATLRVKDKAVVTAGTYERAFELNGKKYHHILDTKTGYPVDTDLVSVTVISDNATDADILSTTLVCLGLNEGLKFIEKQENIEALFITSDGEIHISSGIYCKDGIYRL